MAIYRFSMRDGTDIPDLQITEHDTIEEARREAARIIHALTQVATFDDTDDWILDVADEQGLTLFTATLSFTDAPILKRARL